MTYKLEPLLEKITCPIVLRFPDGNTKQYKTGAELSDIHFNKPYRVKALATINNKIEIELFEADIRAVVRAETDSEQQNFF